MKVLIVTSIAFTATMVCAPAQEVKSQVTVKVPPAAYPEPAAHDRYRIPVVLDEKTTGVSPYASATPVSQAAPLASVETIAKPDQKTSGEGATNNAVKKPILAREVPISHLQGETYIVQAGDNVRSIAKEFKVKPWELRKANHIELKRIYPGQVLLIPRKTR